VQFAQIVSMEDSLHQGAENLPYKENIDYFSSLNGMMQLVF